MLGKKAGRIHIRPLYASQQGLQITRTEGFGGFEPATLIRETDRLNHSASCATKTEKRLTFYLDLTTNAAS